MVRLLHTSDVHIGRAVGTGTHRPVCVCPILAVLGRTGGPMWTWW